MIIYIVTMATESEMCGASVSVMLGQCLSELKREYMLLLLAGAAAADNEGILPHNYGKFCY